MCQELYLDDQELVRDDCCWCPLHYDECNPESYHQAVQELGKKIFQAIINKSSQNPDERTVSVTVRLDRW